MNARTGMLEKLEHWASPSYEQLSKLCFSLSGYLVLFAFAYLLFKPEAEWLAFGVHMLLAFLLLFGGTWFTRLQIALTEEGGQG